MKKLLQNLWNRIKDLHRDTRGFVLMSTLAIFLFLFVLCASIYAVGETIHQRIKLQNACDAAAYSAAVVQADGLSRMATVNRAMAWTYVQMTNRQMDYITYRWLRLTCKRFDEDRENVKGYAKKAQTIAWFDNEIGYWAYLELLVTAAIIDLLQEFGVNLHCSTGNHSDEHEGWTWWCGGPPAMKRINDSIRLNLPLEFSLNGAINAGATAVFKKRVLERALRTCSPVMGDGNTIEKWGSILGWLIDSDKKNIAILNSTLSTINKQMDLSMRITAENVLKNMLKDDSLDSSNALKDYYISINIPTGTDPYKEMDDTGILPSSYFSPLRNTEPDEMLFLGMASPNNTSLANHFPILGQQGRGYGLDQWFIRGRGIYTTKKEDVVKFNNKHSFDEQNGASYKRNKSGYVSDSIRLYGTERSEGELGIQRVYKDANLNETQAGVKLANWTMFPVSRGNHIANFSLSVFGDSGTSTGISLLMNDILSNVLSYFASGLFDIQASVGNGPRDLGMCKKIAPTAALYADYEWASAKWFCLTSAKAYAYTIIKEGSLTKFWCDMERQGRRPWGYIKEKLWRKSSGYGHWEFPKFFCGNPPHVLDKSETQWANIPGVDRLLAKIPPTFGERISNTHGYMKRTLDFNGFIEPLKPLVRAKKQYSRDGYNSCAMFLDGPFRPDKGNHCPAGYLLGHARIYGDDKEIFDNRYVGAICKPWVLNERFFSGKGTIYVGAAMKHVNPFVRLFSMLGDNVTQENNDKTIFSAFNVPQREYGKKAQFYYMWTMSAARAGVRHTRRGGDYDQPRKYQVVYDPTSDPENLFYNGTPLVYSPEDKTWHSVINGQVMNWDDPDNPNALTRTNLEKQSHAAIWDGCPCGESSMQLSWNWNLCETDWDATLLPVRFSWAKALLFHSIEHKNGKKIEKSYNTVDKTARETYIYQSPEFQRVARLEWNKDKYDAKSLGCGENWVWEDPDFITFGNPYLVGIWKPAADQIYLPIPGAATPSTRVSLNLDGKIPEGKDTKKVNLYYLWRGKWL